MIKIKTEDNKIIELESEIAFKSEFLQMIVLDDEYDKDDEIEIKTPKDILDKVFEYCKHIT